MSRGFLVPDYRIAELSQVPVNMEQAISLIIGRAKQLVNQSIDGRGHDKPPFLPEEFARLRGIKEILKTDLGETSAVMIKLHDGNVIMVNEKHNLARQNFSCAHEIGHTLLSELKLEPCTENVQFRTFNPQARAIACVRLKERLCDIAATELLMPESIFSKYLTGFGTSIQSIERLADIFRVSIRAAAQRIAEVSIEPCITMVWQPLTSERLLRMALCKGPGINIASKSNYVPKHTKVKYPSILHKAYKQDSHVKCYKDFKFGKDSKRLPMESKGFGRGENRYVVSLAFPER